MVKKERVLSPNQMADHRQPSLELDAVELHMMPLK